MNEDAIGRRLAAQLSAAARELDGSVAERLRVARERALATQRPAGWLPALVVVLSALRYRTFYAPAFRSAVTAALILAVFFGGGYWATLSRDSEILQVDAALLMDDLPIDAYLDPEFKAWLFQDSRS